MSERMYRDKVARLTKELADAEKKEGQERAKLNKLRAEADKLRVEAARTTSASTARSKQNQAQSKDRQAEQVQRNVSGLQTSAAKKLQDLTRAKSDLGRAEAAARRKQDQEDKKRRDTETRHERELTREAERRARAALRSVLPAPPPERIKVVFLAASPVDQDRLRLDEEVRGITQMIRASDHRDSVELVSRWAVRPLDLLQILNEDKPHVLHFSGHGAETGELVFQADDGGSKLVPKEAIVTTISTAAEGVQVIVFNCCHSTDQAQGVAEHVDVAIGMDDEIGDEAARIFASRFYSAIGFGKSVQNAFDQGIAALKLEGIPKDSTPQLFAREGVDPTEMFLVRPPPTGYGVFNALGS
jgi:hypothetical protein